MPGARYRPPPGPRLLLTLGPELLEDGGPLLVACNGLPRPWERKEPAGHAFHEAALRKSGFYDGDGAEDSSSSGGGMEEKEGAGGKTESPSVDSYHFKGKRKSSADGEQQDHYALLGLSHLRFLATEEQIRKSYRDVALKHHPDKQAALLALEKNEKAREVKREEIDRHFKAIQEAYEVLTDPTKRRLYDSIDEFDDEVPSDCSSEDFFKVFGPVFLRNGRWSLVQPVPGLGEDSTPMAEVDSFYNFWWRFKSWREFPHADEFDLEQAESREHKRWMERQNGKLREKARKEEIERIRTLSDNAYKRDPRIVRRKEEEKAQKQRRIQAKALAREEKEKEAARLLEEERHRKEEEERNAALAAAAQKKNREKEKKMLRKERQRLRAAASGFVARKDSSVSEEAIEFLCTSLEMAAMTRLCESLENSKGFEKQGGILRTALRGSEHEVAYSEEASTTVPLAAQGSAEQEDRLGQPPATEKSAKGPLAASEHPKAETGADGVVDGGSALNGNLKKERPWSKEEMDLLRKAVTKFPKGTSQRWEVVSNYIGTGRTVDEILKAIKSVLFKKPDSSQAYDSFLSKRKPAADIASPLSTRDDDLAAAAAATAAASNGNPSKPISDGPASSSRPNFDGNTIKPNFDTKGNLSGGVQANGVGSGPTEVAGDSVPISSPPPPEDNNSGSDGPSAATAADENSASTDPEAWSDVQELALVKALKVFPAQKKDAAQRWERIAAAVPGKSKVQCYKKFAELRENFRNKKGGD